MFNIAKVLVLLAVASVTIANPLNNSIKCDKDAAHKGKIELHDCELVLNKYQQKGQWIVDNKSSNRKSCYGCQVVFETKDGRDIAIPRDVAWKALKDVLGTCHSHAGTTWIPQDSVKPQVQYDDEPHIDHEVSVHDETSYTGYTSHGSLVVTVRNGFGKECDDGTGAWYKTD
ncbi:uncharacterized protein MELLADRAFT_107458 [Melampsora larici-populina 98AG31]|uniref:Secreted protein n=1 Tax=Melampsora larici-populina (strain 98AG31 / pathotype 3-4-7) TaxID=747676 RepID=F4RPW1_MELLP|nr:uncharacterized protein MELLADRAFT_107458 [Melampsora larici-populina 98AG31]EGG05617.1 secreted protein [Melampsora larici-populina 98AG31]